MDEISFHRMLKVMEAQGIVLQDMGRHEAALCALRRATALTPKTESSTDTIKARIFFSISRSGMALEEPETVHDALDASQRYGHDIGLILNVKGLLARSQMQHADALKYLTKSIRRNPLEARYAAQCICNESLHIQFDDHILSICFIFLHEFLLYSSGLILILQLYMLCPSISRSHKQAAVEDDVDELTGRTNREVANMVLGHTKSESTDLLRSKGIDEQWYSASSINSKLAWLF